MPRLSMRNSEKHKLKSIEFLPSIFCGSIFDIQDFFCSLPFQSAIRILKSAIGSFPSLTCSTSHLPTFFLFHLPHSHFALCSMLYALSFNDKVRQIPHITGQQHQSIATFDRKIFSHHQPGQKAGKHHHQIIDP